MKTAWGKYDRRRIERGWHLIPRAQVRWAYVHDNKRPQRKRKPTRIEFDPNVRTKHNWTYSGFEDIIAGPFPKVGDPVLATEVEDGIEFDGTVTEIRWHTQLILFEVVWDSGRDRSDGVPPTRPDLWEETP